MRRRLLILLVAMALAPGTFVRTPLPPLSQMPPVELAPLAIAQDRFGPFTAIRGWQLDSTDPRAGGYSGLLWRGADSLLAASDNGRLLEIAALDSRPSGRQRPIFARGAYDKVSGDIEALAGAGGGGAVWAAAEGRNAITRASAALVWEAEARPAPMAGWPTNAGPETFARLPDGRFIVVAEKGRGPLHAGVIFSGDPTGGGPMARFAMAVPGGYRPVDAVAAPGGDVLVLLRRVKRTIPPGFATAIARYAIGDLALGAVWSPQDHFALAPSLPPENYEGIALRPGANGGAARVWLVSDDNLSAFQRSLLLELEYRP